MTKEEAIKEARGRIQMQKDMSIYPSEHKTREMEFLEICLRALENFEKTPLAPRRGEWVYPYETTTMICHCSVCGGSGNGTYKFCPHCGAVMKKEI